MCQIQGFGFGKMSRALLRACTLADASTSG